MDDTKAENDWRLFLLFRMAEPLQLLSIKAIKHQINSKSMKREAAANSKLGVLKIFPKVLLRLNTIFFLQFLNLSNFFNIPCCLSFWNFRLEYAMHRTPTSLGTLAGLRTSMPAEDERSNKATFFIDKQIEDWTTKLSLQKYIKLHPKTLKAHLSGTTLNTTFLNLVKWHNWKILTHSDWVQASYYSKGLLQPVKCFWSFVLKLKVCGNLTKSKPNLASKFVTSGQSSQRSKVSIDPYRQDKREEAATGNERNLYDTTNALDSKNTVVKSLKKAF